MTVAVGLYTKAGVSLLADRRTSFGNAILENCKIRKAGRYHYVSAGFTAARDVFDEALSRASTVSRLRSIVDLTSWTPNTGPGEPMTVDVLALVTDGKKLWRIDGGFVAYEVTTPFDAIGSGGQAALGALHAGATPEQAIEIAGRICWNCGNGHDRVDVPKRPR